MSETNHLKIVDQDGRESILCLSRDAGTAIVLRAHPEQLQALFSIAYASKVPTIRIIVDPTNKKLVNKLLDEGWKVSNCVVMERKTL